MTAPSDVQTPDPRRRLPAVGTLCDAAAARPLAERFGPAAVADALRAVLAETRARLRTDPTAAPTPAELIAAAALRLEAGTRETLFPVINATGVVIHTNLGRAPLAPEA